MGNGLGQFWVEKFNFSNAEDAVLVVTGSSL